MREKAIGAYNAFIDKIFVPKENEKDIDDIPEEVKDKIRIIFVSKYDEIYKQLFK